MNGLRRYMADTFPGLVLEPGLFYRWPTSLRFGLRPLSGECRGGEEPRPEWADKADYKLMEDLAFRSHVYGRAHAIFREVHRPTDRLFLVVTGSRTSDAAKRRHQGLRGLRRFFKRRQFPLDLSWIDHSEREDEFSPDDRGIDVVFRNPAEFRATYHRLGDWLLAYDLRRMDEAFSTT